MSQTYTGPAFAKALTLGTPLSPIFVAGMVKAGDDEEHIWFAPGTRCHPDAWVHVPVDVIERVELIVHVPCDDHDHPFVHVYFKSPPESDSQAYLFSQLLRRTAETSSGAGGAWPSDFAVGGSGPCPKELCVRLCKLCQKEGGKWCRYCRDCWESCKSDR